jgi:GAF domain-containing protein
MDEEARLEALRKYRILDTAPEPQFDRIAEIARRQFDVPVALVAFMDSDRNFLKAHGDLPFDESPRSVSFCGHTILDDRVLVVGDATQDMRFAESPLVVGETALRFYAGAPLTA